MPSLEISLDLLEARILKYEIDQRQISIMIESTREQVFATNARRKFANFTATIGNCGYVIRRFLGVR